jgi:FMN-dependent NADH-azoreductase
MDGSGLVTGKKATVLIASGGVYTEGSPIRDRDIATPGICAWCWGSSASPT